MFIGILKSLETCLILGQVSHNLLYSMKKLLTDIHLDNARKLRGIYFIDPEDKELKETIKNARKKLETSVAPALPCKIVKNCGSGVSDRKNTTCVYSGSQ